MKMLHSTVAVCGLLLTLLAGQATAARTWTTLDCPNGTVTNPNGISGNKIVGSYKDAAGHKRGFLYNHDLVTWDTLGPPNAIESIGTDATGICGDEVVGTYAYGTVLAIYGSYRYNGTSYTRLDQRDFAAADIDGNNIVGTYWSGEIDPGSGMLSQGFLYDGATWTLLNPPGALYGDLNGVSGNKMVGIFRGYSWGMRGFLYDGGTWGELWFAPRVAALPYDIDGDRIVGYYYGTSPGEQHGFLYDGHAWLSLDFPGAQSTVARGISGDNIVGYYTDSSGVQHGFLLTVPEPATLSLLALGGLLIARRRRVWPTRTEYSASPLRALYSGEPHTPRKCGNPRIAARHFAKTHEAQQKAVSLPLHSQGRCLGRDPRRSA